MSATARARDLCFTCEEIDPDVFGEELEHPPYDRADRIAAVAITVDHEEIALWVVGAFGWIDWPNELEGPRFAAFQSGLTTFNARGEPGLPHAARARISADATGGEAEAEFVEALRRAITPLAADIPCDVDGFIAWFEQLKETGPGPGRPTVSLARRDGHAEQMKWFLLQEVAGEAGFRRPPRDDAGQDAGAGQARNGAQLLGRNGTRGGQGNARADAGTLADFLRLAPTPDTVVPESLALGNTMIALARHRRFAYHSVGALGVIEMTAPTRAGYVDRRPAAAGSAGQESGTISPSTRCSTSSIRKRGIAKCCGRL